MANYEKHYPVMLSEVISSMSPKDGEVYVDCTFGNGGYTESILKSANCKVIALDRDPNVLPRVEELKQQYGDRFEFVSGRFGDLANLLSQPVNGFVFDIGVSSMQLDEGDRGFSFSKDAPLDMRMSCSGESAADVVNGYKEEDIANIIYKYGEERKSRYIAKKIVEFRQVKTIDTTTELADIVRSVVKKEKSIDPATKTFQALRIFVNDELGELERGLSSAVDLLKPEGRLVVVTFHSLEDRIVKNFFRELSGNTPNVSRYMPEVAKTESVFSKVSKAIIPSENELEANKRSRSAKLRFGIKK